MHGHRSRNRTGAGSHPSPRPVEACTELGRRGCRGGGGWAKPCMRGPASGLQGQAREDIRVPSAWAARSISVGRT